MAGPRNRADPALSNLVRQGGKSRPAQLPLPNPSILDHAAPTCAGPLYAWLAVGVVCAFVLCVALTWLMGAH